MKIKYHFEFQAYRNQILFPFETRHDYLYVRNEEDVQPIINITGNSHQNFVFLGEEIHLSFVSDDFEALKGFKIRYEPGILYNFDI